MFVCMHVCMQARKSVTHPSPPPPHLSFPSPHTPRGPTTKSCAFRDHVHTHVQVAFKKRCKDIVEELCEKGADVGQIAKEAAVRGHGWTALHLAAEIGSLKLCQGVVKKVGPVYPLIDAHLPIFRCACARPLTEVKHCQGVVKKGDVHLLIHS